MRGRHDVAGRGDLHVPQNPDGAPPGVGPPTPAGLGIRSPLSGSDPRPGVQDHLRPNAGALCCMKTGSRVPDARLMASKISLPPRSAERRLVSVRSFFETSTIFVVPESRIEPTTDS